MAVTSMKITYGTSKPKRKPKLGDTKVVKGVTYVRDFKYVTDCKGRKIGYDCTGGKQRYEWIEKKP